MNIPNRWFAASLLLATTSLMTACGSSSSSTTPPSLSSIAVTPPTATLAKGATRQLTVTGTYSDGSVAPLTSTSTFSSSATSVATVSASGLVTAVAGGSATITASNDGKTSTSVITVTPTLLSIAATPTTTSLSLGGTQALTVTATYDAGAPATVTSTATYASSDTAVATVSAAGVVTAVTPGTATVTATYQTKSATVAVTVNAPVLQSIAASPTSKTLSIGATQALAVTATYDVGPTSIVTVDATYGSSNTAVATVSADGVVTAVSGGSATITATYQTKTATVAITVNPVVLQTITVSPLTPTLSVVGTQALTVTATYDIGPTADVTADATYASDATSVATVSAAGLISAVAPGTATITATYQTKTATSAVTVTTPNLVSIAVAPTTVGLVPGNSQALTVTATYDAGPTKNVTSTATYATSDGLVATVSSAGLVTAVAVGTATITATLSGQTATSAVTVTAMPTGGLVFWDDYAAGAGPLAAFNGSDTAANPVVRDTVETNNGRASLKITANGSCAGYVGGYIASATPRDLSAYNVMSFWAKAAAPGAPIHNIGFGNDNTTNGTNSFNVESHGAAGNGFDLTTTWQKFYVPIPNPAALAAVNGLFYFSGGCSTFTVWVNDIQFETLTAPQLAAAVGTFTSASGGVPATLAVEVGTPASFGSGFAPNTVHYTVANVYQVGWAYFTYVSSAPAVATVDGSGMVVGHTVGTSSISAALLGTALGTTTVTVTVPLAVPTTTLTPDVAVHPVANVVSVYNSAAVYTDLLGVNWFPNWGQATTFADTVIAGKTLKKYSGMNYQGWDFSGTPINASTFTHLHVDVWTPNATKLGVAVINFGTPHTEFTVPFNATSTPPITQGAWISLDIPLTAFTGVTFEAVSQIKWVDDASISPAGGEFGTFYFDNVYFWK